MQIMFLVKIYQKYQSTNIYKRNCLQKAQRRYNWLKKNSVRLGPEVVELVCEMQKNCDDEYTRQMNYSFVQNYNSCGEEIHFDNIRQMYYAQGIGTDNKKMYFPHSWDDVDKISEYYKTLCYEQHKESPHRYLSDSTALSDEDVVIDIGSAEGNFSLSIVDKVRKLFLFERDPEWIEALKATFEPYKEKVVIINKYVSNRNDRCCITLDTFLDNEELKYKNLVLKMDIEGSEIKALKGAVKTMKEGLVKYMFICVYHNHSDEKKVNKLMRQYDYLIEPAHGYIAKLADLFSFKPYIRRGVLRIIRRNEK